MELPELPEIIRKNLGSAASRADCVGMSGDRVMIYPDLVLKVSHDGPEARREAGVMEWLSGRLPVPEVVECVRERGRQFLLMTRLSGSMLCAPEIISDFDRACRLLAEALEMLLDVPAEKCPLPSTLDEKLALARGFVERGKVDIDNTEPATFGPGGFSGPAQLLSWLTENRPPEDICFIHGDMSLPNVFTDGSHITGFLDLGKAGRGDRYTDLSIALRSLLSNARGEYGGHPPVPGIDPDMLFRILGITRDEEKMKYYLLLDELF